MSADILERLETMRFTRLSPADENEILKLAKDEIVRLRGEVAVTKTLLCQVYTDAYHAGHNDTVEGLYVDVLPVDRDSYWLEQVEGYAATIAPAEAKGE